MSSDLTPESDPPTGEFLRELEVGFVVHELKGPLAVIETGLRALLERTDAYGPLSPRQEKTLRRLLRSTLKSRSMVSELLEIAQTESGHIIRTLFQPTEAVWQTLIEAIETLASDVCNDLEAHAGEDELRKALARHGIFVTAEPAIATIEIYQDEKKFRQILLNLIKNALRFRRKKLLIRLFRHSADLIVEVSDDGPGIVPQDHERVFRPYVQIGPEKAVGKRGHGLGLAGARLLARRLGGEITLRSEAGKGSVFGLTIPIDKTIDPRSDN